ncbi:MAG: 4-hydroxythreonine-4-phosphate dehydrogenase PdxA [Bacteroidales bacterium]|nr:4-hydroxythreonine-4-phosphate dehydrogenase PdxA [Bacteroidales bacterium]
MNSQKIKIGITQGDINGIGYEIIIKSLLDPRIFEICTPIVYGSLKVAAYHRKALDIENFSLTSIKSPDEANTKRANIINCVDDDVRVELGKSTEIAGEASYTALIRAVEDLKANKLDALITAPINKYNIQSDKFSFAGHTEFLKDYFESKDALMLMVSDLLKIGLITAHIPLSEVPSVITEELVLNKIKLLNDSLIRDFGVRKPKIALLGLNPHAGEEGMIGHEEKDIILPAIAKAKEDKIYCFGPYPADGFFGSGDFRNFDGTLAMYHDQGLIPFKSLVMDEGVNYTAGLPIIRTSPAHGTAFDLAGKNEASPKSFLKAIYTACDIHHNRQFFTEINKNPLAVSDLSDQD